MDQQDRLRKTKSIIDDAHNILEKLNMLAADDGIIDQDEIELLNVINKNIQKYQKLLDEIMEDGNIDDQEVQQMLDFEQEIINAVEEQAKSDGNVSVPEQELMDTLFDCLRNLGDLDEIN